MIESNVVFGSRGELFPDGLRKDRSEGIRTPSPNVFSGIHHRRWGGEVRVRQRGQRDDRKRDTSNGNLRTLHLTLSFSIDTIKIFHHFSGTIKSLASN